MTDTPTRKDDLPPVGSVVRSTAARRMWRGPNRYKVVGRYYKRRRWWLACVQALRSGGWGARQYRIGQWQEMNQ